VQDGHGLSSRVDTPDDNFAPCSPVLANWGSSDAILPHFEVLELLLANPA
jgi:hypothetical protein